MEKTPILKHHLIKDPRTGEPGLLISMRDNDLDPTIENIKKTVLSLSNTSQSRLYNYSFLKKREFRRPFTFALLKMYQAYLSDNYQTISDFDLETGKANPDLLCLACYNWQQGLICSNKTLPPEELSMRRIFRKLYE